MLSCLDQRLEDFSAGPRTRRRGECTQPARPWCTASIPPLTIKLPLGHNIDIQQAHHPWQSTYHLDTIENVQPAHHPYQSSHHLDTVYKIYSWHTPPANNLTLGHNIECPASQCCGAGAGTFWSEPTGAGEKVRLRLHLR